MKSLRQRGELALTLSLLGIFISLIGIGIGTSMTRNIQQSSSQAQDLFTYKSTLEIRNESGQVINWEPEFTWDNAGAGTGLTKGDIKTLPSPLAQVIYDATMAPGVPKALQGFPTTVVIRIPEQKYVIVSAFCEDIFGDTCTNSNVTNDFRTRSNMVIANGAEIRYGVVVRVKTIIQPTPTSVPTATSTPTSCPISGPECAPRNIKIAEIKERSVDIEWDFPQGCAGFKSGSDFWIDVERPGEYIACAAEGGSDGSSQCVLGKTEITQGRQLNTNSEEFKKRKWDENRKYTVKVFTHNVSPSCVSPVASTTFRYQEDSEPTTDPTEIPREQVCKSASQSCVDTYVEACTSSAGIAGSRTCHKSGTCSASGDGTQCSWGAGSYCDACSSETDRTDNTLQCNRPCIYSEGPSTNQRCWKGACPANEKGCGGDITKINRGCAFAGTVCGIRQEVDCKSGESKTTGDGVTACAKQNGGCTQEPICNSESGTVRKDLAGCSGASVCCIFPKGKEITPTQKPTLTTTPTPTITSSPSPTPTEPEKPSDCKHIKGLGKTRIVFLPRGYTNMADLERDVEYLSDSISQTNISHYADRFSYSVHTDLNVYYQECKTLGCAIFHSTIGNIPRNTRECNGDVSVIVINETGRSSGLFGFEIVYLYQKSDVNHPLVLSHELGHAMVSLADEYIEEGGSGPSSSSSPNCSYKDSMGKCKWGDLGHCIQGCAYTNTLFRPEDKSIMFNTSESNEFNGPSLKEWDKYFGVEKPFASIVDSEAEYKNALVVRLNQKQLDVLDMESIQSLDVYPSKSNIVTNGVHYTLVIISSENEDLFSTQISKTVDFYHDDRGEELWKSLDVYLPYFNNADRIIITNENNKEVMNIDLKTHTFADAIPAVSLCGNSVCDAGIGENSNSCRADCGEHLIKSELERSDLDLNKQVNGQDMAILIDEEVYGKSDKGDIDGDSKSNALDYSLLIKWLGGEIPEEYKPDSSTLTQ